VVTACGSESGGGGGKSKADVACRTVDVAPPGEHDGDYCRPVAGRVGPAGERSHYAARVDFRRCMQPLQPTGDKHMPRVVKHQRARRPRLW